MTDKNLNKLERLFNLMDDDALTREQFLAFSKTLVDHIKKIEDKNSQVIAQMTEAFRNAIEKVKAEQNRSTEDIKAATKKSKEELAIKAETLRREIAGKLSEIKDGKDADEEKIVDEVFGRVSKEIYIPDIEELENNLPKLGERIRDGLEVLQGEERLDISAVKGFDELKEELKGSAKNISFVGGARGINLLVDGVKKGMASKINFVPGTNVTMNYVKTGNRTDVTISASGAALAILTATGTIDNANVTFTFISEPVLVVVNGATYRNGAGCTIAGTTVTLDNPVGLGGDIYAIG